MRKAAIRFILFRSKRRRPGITVYGPSYLLLLPYLAVILSSHGIVCIQVMLGMGESEGLNKPTAGVATHLAVDASSMDDDSTPPQSPSLASLEEMDIFSDDSDHPDSADQASAESYPKNVDKSQIPCKYLSRPEGCRRLRCRFSHDLVNSTEDIGRCGICFEEKVKVFGLLSGCNHVFCMACARKWRTTKAGDAAKKCPVCRQTASRLVPASTFLPLGDRRDEYIAANNNWYKNKPCRYFEASKKKSQHHCPMFNRCIFGHFMDGREYIFSDREIKKIKSSRGRKASSNKRTRQAIEARRERRRLQERERTPPRQPRSITPPTPITPIVGPVPIDLTPPAIIAQPPYQPILPTNPHLNAAMEAAETPQRNDRMAEALVDAESRALAAEQRLADIQSNVAQLRVLLDRFQERAARAGILITDRNTIRNLTATDTPEESSPAATNARTRSTARATRGRVATRGRLRARRENGPASTSVTPAIVTEDTPDIGTAAHQLTARNPAADDFGITGHDGNVSTVESAGPQSLQQQSGIDPALIEARNRQWEELRRRLASRFNRDG